MTINCLIIDDEPLAINVIKNYLQEIDNVNIINTFNSAIEALNFLKEHEVDLIFLDINMPLLDGLDFIKNLEKKPLIIITTAYDEYAVKTYELDVLDYLVKPIPFPRFIKAVNRALKAVDIHKSPTHQKIAKRPSISACVSPTICKNSTGPCGVSVLPKTGSRRYSSPTMAVSVWAAIGPLAGMKWPSSNQLQLLRT